MAADEEVTGFHAADGVSGGACGIKFPSNDGFIASIQWLTENFRCFEFSPLTCFGLRAYKPLTNEGGGAASDDVLRSREFQQN